jgi:alginate O-acetyltransferase complex protein AlgI
MVFSSNIFLFIFLPIFLWAYQITPTKFKNLLILLFSIFFYAWGAPTFIVTLLVSMILNYFVVQQMAKTNDKNRRLLLLWTSILLNVGLLLYFKYTNFFIENWNDAFSSIGFDTLGWTKIVLPIGISFFTFQSLSYTMDVYRKVNAPLNKLTDYLLYILMFPQMIAGPIVRFSTIADEINDRTANETYDNKLAGLMRFIIGLAKKVIIANTMAAVADQAFALNAVDLNSATAWLGVIAYTFQIYYDFSGYSDMAIGLGKIMGFTFPENFNNPYISKNITEFWRRWHITLGAWMRDYLYIPLGGNQVNSSFRLYFNLWIVFLISGLWHGASWNFIVWGAFHGLFLVFDRLFLIKLTKRLGLINIPITFFISIVGWVLFRSDTLSDAGIYLSEMFSISSEPITIVVKNEFWLILPLAFLFSFSTLLPNFETYLERLYQLQYSRRNKLIALSVFILIFWFSVSSVASSGFNPFIYFRF